MKRELPIACSLSDDDLTRQRSRWLELVRSSCLAREETSDGVRMRFSRAAIQNVLTEDPEIADEKEEGSAS